MSKKRIKVGVIFGGKSAEHEVSLQSARNVINALDKKKYEVVPIGISKDGKWFLGDSRKYLLNESNPKLIRLNKSNKEVVLFGERAGPAGRLDVVFPVLHGPYGEDGSVQGMLKLAGIPFVGAGVLGSAVGMDKDTAKRLLREAGINVADYLVFQGKNKIRPTEIYKKLGRPVYVKPSNMGSSVGVSKAENDAELRNATKEAFKFDTKIIIEEEIKGREIECSVLGNEKPIASLPGEIIPDDEFYSYDAKYITEGTRLVVPAKLSKSLIKKVQNTAVQVFKTLNCEGMGRVDFFLTQKGKLYVNEINTIPGFTNISMYPKLWEASGISQPELFDRLIGLALERHRKEKKLKSSV